MDPNCLIHLLLFEAKEAFSKPNSTLEVVEKSNPIIKVLLLFRIKVIYGKSDIFCTDVLFWQLLIDGR